MELYSKQSKLHVHFVYVTYFTEMSQLECLL